MDVQVFYGLFSYFAAAAVMEMVLLYFLVLDVEKITAVYGLLCCFFSAVDAVEILDVDATIIASASLHFAGLGPAAFLYHRAGRCFIIIIYVPFLFLHFFHLLP